MAKSSAQIKKELALIRSAREENGTDGNIQANENINTAERPDNAKPKPEQVQQQAQERADIINGIMTGITEGAKEVYDNTVVQIMGDEAKQDSHENKVIENEDTKTKESQINQEENGSGIIDGIVTGITEGAIDVYDNTIVQIMGDVPKQDSQDNNEEKEEEDEKEQNTQAEIAQHNQISPPNIAKNSDEDEQETEKDDFFQQKQSVQSSTRSNDDEMRLIQKDLSLIQEARGDKSPNQNEKNQVTADILTYTIENESR